MRNLLHKGKIIKNGDTVQYDMPALEHMRISEDIPLDQSEVIEREAYERGFASGEKAGLAMGEQKATILLTGLEAIVKAMQELKDITIKELESQVFDLATTIARRIVIEELNTNPEVIVRIVKEAIRKLERRGPITIKINPALYALFLKANAEFINIHPEIIFDVDPSASVTGPLVIGPIEEIVTDMDEQIKNIIEDIRGSIGTH